VKISIAIQHHPARASLLARLAGRIPAEIVEDPDPGAMRNPWRTYHHALGLTPKDATHRIVIQDDAIVCDHFLEAVTAAISAHPDRFFTLFVSRQLRKGARSQMASCAEDRPWALLNRQEWVPVVALVWPVEHVWRMLEWAPSRGYLPERKKADDHIVGEYARATNTDIYATVPSLVDHPDDVPSLIGQRRGDRNRQAVCFVAGDAREIDWTRD